MADFRESRPGIAGPPHDGNQHNQGESRNGRAQDALHQHRVQQLRGYIDHQQKAEKARGRTASPAHIIRSKLKEESLPSKERGYEFLTPIRTAWDALAFDRYDSDSYDKYSANMDLWETFGAQKYHSPKQKIIVTPDQATVLDALAEAADIPRTRGQTEIEIPERARTVSKEREKLHNDTMMEFLGGRKKR